MGPANPLYLERTGYSATMWGLPYDDVNGWRGPYPAEVLAAQFEKIAQGWQPGLEELRRAVEAAPEAQRAEVRADLQFAQAAAIQFQSVSNQTRFVSARGRREILAADIAFDQATPLLWKGPKGDTRVPGFAAAAKYTRGHAFNVGGGPTHTISLVELLELAEQLGGRRPDVSHAPVRVGDQRWYVSDPRKIEGAIGWSPRTDVRRGVERLLAWLRDPTRLAPRLRPVVDGVAE